MEQEQKNILDHLKVKPVNEISEAYFVDLAHKSVTNKKKIVSLKFAVWSAAAAIALLLVSLPLLNQGDSDGNKYSFNLITASEALAYVDEHINEFDDDMIIEFITNEKIAVPEINIETNKQKFISEPIESLEEIDTESILEYLIYEGIEDDNIDEYEL